MGREETSIQQKPDISKQNVAYIPVSKFNHPTQKYAMFAFSAAIFVAIGGFLLGIGDTKLPNHDLWSVWMLWAS